LILTTITTLEIASITRRNTEFK